MGIKVVNVNYLTSFKPKSHSPISRNGNSIMTFHFPSQRVKLKTWKVYVLRLLAPVKHCKNIPEFLDMLWCHPPGRSFIVKVLQASMLERRNH